MCAIVTKSHAPGVGGWELKIYLGREREREACRLEGFLSSLQKLKKVSFALAKLPTNSYRRTDRIGIVGHISKGIGTRSQLVGQSWVIHSSRMTGRLLGPPSLDTLIAGLRPP